MDIAQIIYVLLVIIFVVFITILVALALQFLLLTRRIKSVMQSIETVKTAVDNSANQYNRIVVPAMLIKNIVTKFNKSKKKDKSLNGDEKD